MSHLLPRKANQGDHATGHLATAGQKRVGRMKARLMSKTVKLATESLSGSEHDLLLAEPAAIHWRQSINSNVQDAR